MLESDDNNLTSLWAFIVHQAAARARENTNRRAAGLPERVFTHQAAPRRSRRSSIIRDGGVDTKDELTMQERTEALAVGKTIARGIWEAIYTVEDLDYRVLHEVFCPHVIQETIPSCANTHPVDGRTAYQLKNALPTLSDTVIL